MRHQTFEKEKSMERIKLTSPTQIKQLLQGLAISPRKSYGQNFLIDVNILNIMTQTAQLNASDIVLEVGPGLGILTEAMLPHIKQLIAIEKDIKLHSYLLERFKQDNKLTLIQRDAVQLTESFFEQHGIHKIVSNLPYSSGSRMIVEWSSFDNPPQQIVATLQKDVVDRITATQGSSNFCLMSILTQNIYKIAYVKTIHETCFYPPPKVKSSIIELKKRMSPIVHPQNKKIWMNLIKEAFCHRRKQIQTILKQHISFIPKKSLNVKELLYSCSIDGIKRPAELSFQEWVLLADCLSNH
jgi:16S rRNA (adenine1518-N6/adenine1519-N6)-dimethyltransferase